MKLLYADNKLKCFQDVQRHVMSVLSSTFKIYVETH